MCVPGGAAFGHVGGPVGGGFAGIGVIPIGATGGPSTRSDGGVVAATRPGGVAIGGGGFVGGFICATIAGGGHFDGGGLCSAVFGVGAVSWMAS